MDLDEARHQLVLLARRRKARVIAWTREMPTDWRPYQVLNPLTSQVFTQEGAWQYIADLLENGHALQEIELHQPAGRRGYVMLVELAAGAPRLYVKLQLGSGRVIGRSFHYSKE